MNQFFAGAIAAQRMEDIEVDIVIFAEDPDGDGMRLELQRAVAFDEQDAMHGMDTYCLVLDTGATHYGGVESWSLGPDRLRLVLDAGATGELAVASPFEIGLDLSPAQVDELRAAVQHIFRMPPAVC